MDESSQPTPPPPPIEFDSVTGTPSATPPPLGEELFANAPIAGPDTPPRLPPTDPWAHRRGEPRVFAFLWTVYVLLSVAGSVLWVSRFSAVSPGSFSPAARIMLVVVAVGATILWPMVRLSQASPRQRVPSHVLADTLVVLFPIQLIVWPLIVLAGWPIGIVVTVAATLAAWVVLTGGLLAHALLGTSAFAPGQPVLRARSLWMVVILAVIGAAPLLTLMCQIRHVAAPAWLAMLSPLTAIPLICGSGMSGPQNPTTPLEIQFIVLTTLLAGGLWLTVGVRAMLGNRRDAA